MPKTKTKLRSKTSATKSQRPKTTSQSNKGQLDSIYILKLTAYLLLGSTWIHFTNSTNSPGIPIPIGAFAGVIIASRERFQIDRKIEYAILLVALFIGYFLSSSLTIVI